MFMSGTILLLKKFLSFCLVYLFFNKKVHVLTLFFWIHHTYQEDIGRGRDPLI